jgi:hypothetical protein
MQNVCYITTLAQLAYRDWQEGVYTAASATYPFTCWFGSQAARFQPGEDR